MSTPWTVIIAVLVVAALYVLIPWMAYVFARYRGTRLVRCPETGIRTAVDIDAAHAAWTAALGEPRLRVRWCRRWPEREGCARGCLRRPEIERPAA